MGPVLHGWAKTPEGVRFVIKKSQEGLKTLSNKQAINPQTVAQWKKRETVQDATMGPKNSHSPTLSLEEEAAGVAFRQHPSLLPLDDGLYAVQSHIVKRTRLWLHKLLKRHGIGRLPKMEGDKEPKKTFKAHPIGYLHIDSAEGVHSRKNTRPLSPLIAQVRLSPKRFLTPMGKLKRGPVFKESDPRRA